MARTTPQAHTSQAHTPRARFGPAARRLAAILGTATLFGALLSPAAAYAVDPVDASISGTVTIGTGTAPLEAVTVVAENYDDGTTFEAMTEADGSYEVTDLPAGSYTLSFEAPEDTDYVTEWYNNSLTPDDAAVLALAASQHRTVNAGLALGGKLAGTVTGTAGAKLGDVFVEVYPFGGTTAIASASTGPDGTYLLRGIPASGVSISFTDDADRGYVTQWSTSRANQATSDKITVPAGGTTTAGAALAVGGSISGTVTGQSETTGVPLGDALVTLFTTAGDFVADAYTDAQGAYSLKGLPAGTYRLGFDAPEGSSYGSEYWQNKPDFDTATSIAVSTGQVLAGYNAELASGGAIAGVVTGSNTAGAGIEGVDVTAFDDFGDEAGTASTGADGAYVITGLPAGDYRLQFTTTEVPTYAPQWWKNKATIDDAQIVTVTTGVTTTGKGTVLQLGGTIAGLVTGSDAPTVGLDAIAVTAYDLEGFEISTAETTADGTFTLRGIPAGKVTLGYHDPADPATYLDEYWNNKTSLETAQYFTATSASTITGRDAVLAFGASIGGVVTGDDAPGVPLAGVAVGLFGPDHEYVADAVTGNDGSYRFTPLAAGSYKLSFTGPAGSDYGSEWWDDAQSFGTASSIVLTESASVTADAGLDADVQELDEPPVPTIEGQAKVGGTLTAVAGAWGPAPVELSYQWLANDDPIAGATGATFEPGVDEFESTLSVTVTGGKKGFTDRSVTSDATTPVAAGTFPTVAPLVTGSFAVGKTLKATPGALGVDDVEFHYRWKNNGTGVNGGYSETYKLRSSDAGDTITVTVTAVAYGYADRAQTSAPAKVGKVLTKTSTPKISGTAKVGKTLKASAGSWKPSKVSFHYQWKRNGVAITGATKSRYKLTKSDRSKKITVTVTGSKSGYTPVSKSSKSKKIH